MKTKLLTLFVALGIAISLFAKVPTAPVIYQDCSKNGLIVDYRATGSAAVSSTSGRTSCEWVQLWEGGPKWATFNVGATITDYAHLTIGADPTYFLTSAIFDDFWCVKSQCANYQQNTKW